MRGLARRLIPLLLTPALALVELDSASGQTALPGDPPARVGRLSHVEGQVSARTPDQADWSAAVLNYPVSTGLALWTEPAARAEISYGDGALRLDHETAIAVERLDDSALDLRLDQGSVQLSVRQLEPGERVSITTPQGRMEALAPGTYRIDAGTGETPAGVTVLDGKARFADQGRSVEAVGGESAVVRQDGSLGTVAAIRRPFDEWALAREAEVKAATVTPQHVPASMPGREDLDRHGTWQQVPQYGAVWYPTAVPVGWEPYRYGHWAWVHPWGWTWIDDAPWGFAPFHYGRWVHHHGRWGWFPGHFHHHHHHHRARPVYAPALVAFIGGSNFSIGISVGRAPAIGWVPLGPREVYYPHYRSSVTYVRNINVIHVEKTVINNINVTRIKNGPSHRDFKGFVNHRAATVVPVDAMRRAEPVQRAMPRRDFDDADFRSARPTTNLASVQPSRAARAGFRTEDDGDRRGTDRATERSPDRTPDRVSDRGDERQASRQASPGRPVTNDAERVPTAPGPRREANVGPDRAPQARSGPGRTGPDRGGDNRATQERRSPQDATPRVMPERGPERGGPERGGPERNQGERAAPAQRGPAPSAGPQVRERDASPPSREAQERDARPQRQPGREGSPSRREFQSEGQPRRSQLAEPAAPASRSEPPTRSRMPTVHGPGQDQGREIGRDIGREMGQAGREPRMTRAPDAPRMMPVRRAEPDNAAERQRAAMPSVHAPRAARIEPPQRPNVERRRPEASRPEAPRPETRRPEVQRSDNPRAERPRGEQRRMEERSERRLEAQQQRPSMGRDAQR